MNSDRDRFPELFSLLRRRPQAFARLQGSEAAVDLRGTVRFYQTAYGVFVVAEMMGLPDRNTPCDGPIFAFHIHEGGTCANSACRDGICPRGVDPFADAGRHYNPFGCVHPYHAGDLPPLFGVNGIAFSAFLTDRFTVDEVIGKTVIVHASPDDFMTQPAGNAGAKIACGRITRFG